jgi:hypothetical protein
MSGISWAPMVATSSGDTFAVQNGKNTRGYRPQATMGYSTQAAPVSQQYPAQSYVQNPGIPYMVLRNASRPATPQGWYGRAIRGTVANSASAYGPQVMASMVPAQHQTGPWGGPFGARRRGRKTRKNRSKRSRSRKAKK